MFIIAGLGNPGKRYENTRHNVGFDAIDELVDRYRIPGSGVSHKAMVGKGIMEGQKVLLAKPLTYMNLSGEAIRGLVDYYKIDPETELLVIYDDISLEPGNIRIRKKGSAGGHNGIKSIIAHIGTQTFDRIRVGIDKDPRIPTVNWVLGKIRKEDMDAYLESVNEAAKAAVFSVTHEFTETMNQFNKKQVKE